MRAPALVIRPTTSDDWREVRELRLEMLRDTPLAYTDTLEETLEFDEAEWRRRAARGESEVGISLVAIARDGRWVGTMGCVSFRDEPWPMLVSVYVAPAFRGAVAGVTDALLARMEGWARARASALMLHVHEQNPRAIRAYERRGFVASGASIPYPLDAAQRELEMIKRL